MRTRMLGLLRAFVCHSQKRCCRYLVCRNHGLMARSLPLLRGLQRNRCLGCLNQNGVATPGVRQLLRRRSFGGPEAKAPVNCPKAKRLWGDRHRGRRRCNPWEAHLRRIRLKRSSCADDVDGRHVSGQEERGEGGSSYEPRDAITLVERELDVKGQFSWEDTMW